MQTRRHGSLLNISMKKIIVPGAEAGRRIDKYLMKYFDAAPKSFIYKAFRKKNIKLCGKRAAGSELLNDGDVIELFFSDETIASLRKADETIASHRKSDDSVSADNAVRHNDGRTNAAGRNEQTGSISEKYGDRSISRIRKGDKTSLKSYCDIVYEDDNIILADKRYGVLSQKAAGSDYSLNEALLDYCGGRRPDSTFVPSVANRIDRNTTGLVCFARSYGASRELSRLLKARELKKYYIAVVSGRITESKHLEAWLRKDAHSNRVDISDIELPGAERIETAFRHIDADEAAELGVGSAFGAACGSEYTILKVELITGKSHQIRAHLASIGHPILGDPKYGKAALNRSLRDSFGIRWQLLHAFELTMPDKLAAPLEYLSGRSFRTDVPEGIKRLIAKP